MSLPKDAYLDARVAAKVAAPLAIPAPPSEPPAVPAKSAALDPVQVVSDVVAVEHEFAGEPGASWRAKLFAFLTSAHAMTLIATMAIDAGAGAVGVLPANESKLLFLAAPIVLAACEGAITASKAHATITAAALRP